MIPIRNHKSIFVALFFAVFFFSCDDTIEFIQFEPIENAAWDTSKKVTFDFSIQDTILPKNLFIHVRNTGEYPFSNMYVITTLTFPDETKVIDTLHYEMADATGKFLGKGIADSKESKLFYKEQKVFPKTGKYQFQVRQAMRKNGEVKPLQKLQGIQDIGFSIEKVNEL
jgi:gliding motility-associated lipoprotein GldH